jgi:hypothetical protein
MDISKINLQVALDHAAAGIPMFPAKAFPKNDGTWGKKPSFTDWQKLATTDEAQIRQWWGAHPDAIPGIELSGADLVVIDGDRHGGPDGVAALAEIMTEEFSRCPVTNTAGNGQHSFFRQPAGEKLGNRRGNLPEGIDVRGRGGWIVAPGTVRPDGAIWQPKSDAPSLIESYRAGTIPELPADVLDLIRKPKTKGNGYHSGGFHGERERAYAEQALRNLANELAAVRDTGRNEGLNGCAYKLGRMIGAGWIDRGTVEGQLHAAMVANGYVKSDGWPAVEATLKSGLDAGIRQPHEPLPERGERKTKRKPVHDWDAPDWSILDDRRGELPAFPTNAVPGAEIIALAAHGAGVSFDHVAVPLITIASGVIGTMRRVKASRSWTEPAALWGAMVGLSGSGKTPGINVTKRALVEVERKRRTTIEEKRRSHEARREAAKLAREQWKAKLKETAEETVVSLDQFRGIKAAEPMPAAAEDPGPFIVPRLFVTDSTIERLAQLISARPSGALMVVDELAALFLNLSRYSGGSDWEFWLQAWCGDHYRVERMGRDPVDLAHLLVAIVGGLQPDKLSRSFQGDHDGLTARVLYSWPPEPPYRPLSNEVAELEPEIFNAIDRLANLESGQGMEGEFAPRAIPLSGSAVADFEHFRQFVHGLKEGLDGRERDWAAKMPAHALRLALTLCLLDYGFRGGAEPTEISAAFMNAAIELVKDYYFPHARAALRQIGLSEKHATARRVLRWIRANHCTEISIMDIRREALAQSLNQEQTLAVIETLEKGGWFRETTVETGAKGRPARRWAVNPELHAGNAVNAENGT